jgi:hypothetical protein
MSSQMIDFYGAAADEGARLRRSPHGRLEFLRTRELVRRPLMINSSAHLLAVARC